MSRTLIRKAQIVFPDGVRTSDLSIEEGIIRDIGQDLASFPNDEIIDAEGHYLLPGFIDIHNHGAVGLDFASGVYHSEKAVFDHTEKVFWEGLERLLAFYLKTGTTRIYLTTIAAPLESLEHSMRLLDEFLRNHPQFENLVAGINVEGSFLKLPAYAGAQNPDFFYPPDLKILDRFQKASGDRIRLVNVPPEHGTVGLDLIRYAKSQHIVVAGGHSGAFALEFEKAVEAGLSLAVHFLNGPSRSSSKSFQDGGAIESILRNDAVSVELIVDGYHVHPQYVRDVMARKGVERCIGITDSIFVNGTSTIDRFEMCGLEGRLSENREYLEVVGKENSLFGSVLCTDRGFNNLLNWLTSVDRGVWYRTHERLSLNDALVVASQLCSGNPAQLMGIDQKNAQTPATGSIAIGNSADLLLAKIEGNAGQYHFKIWSTLNT